MGDSGVVSWPVFISTSFMDEPSELVTVMRGDAS
jgi:hypothetical protein